MNRKPCVWVAVAVGVSFLLGGAALAGPPDPPPKPAKKLIVKTKRRAFEWPAKKRGYLGVGLLDLTEELREFFGAPKGAGVLVSQVEKDSPAAKVGLRAGDVLVQVDDRPVGSTWEAVRLVGRKKEGEKAAIKIVRAGKEQSLQATIRERDKAQVEVSRFIRTFPGGQGDVEIDLDTEHLQDYLQGALGDLENPDAGQRWQVIDRESDLEKRLEQMEQKLQELQKQIESRLPAAKP